MRPSLTLTYSHIALVNEAIYLALRQSDFRPITFYAHTILNLPTFTPTEASFLSKYFTSHGFIVHTTPVHLKLTWPTNTTPSLPNSLTPNSFTPPSQT